VKEKETNKRKQAGRASHMQAPLYTVRTGQKKNLVFNIGEERFQKE